MPTIKLTATFVRALKALPPDRSRRIRKTLDDFAENPSLPGLRLHKLEELNVWSLSSGKKDHIILEPEQGTDQETWLLLDVGAHDHVYRQLKRR